MRTSTSAVIGPLHLIAQAGVFLSSQEPGSRAGLVGVTRETRLNTGQPKRRPV
jgi:hypothetical protein